MGLEIAQHDPARPRKLRLLVFIVAYNAERTIDSVLNRIPDSLKDVYDVEVLAIDDASSDGTFDAAYASLPQHSTRFPVVILRNPVNQGYGGNQKIGFFYAMQKGFDVVALVHGDGQYAPECLPELMAPLRRGEAEAVFGSRMLTSGAARQGGMPLYKFVGNKVLTTIQNALLGTALSEFHSGYRLYSVAALRRIPFHLNTNDFHFDTEIIIQLCIAGLRIREIAIPTYYGDEICHVNGLAYAWNVVITTLRARSQELGVFYDRKFDCRARKAPSPYQAKLGFSSPHSEALARIKPGSRVVDIGAGDGHLAEALATAGCTVIGLDRTRPESAGKFTDFLEADLNAPLPAHLFAGVNTVLMLDVIEHLHDPEAFVDALRSSPTLSAETWILASTGNVAFLPTRLGLLLGLFNYGPRGILDRTHTRLFTFGTFRGLFEQAGFDVLANKGIPAPFPLALGHGLVARVLLLLNRIAIRIRAPLFSYQVFIVARKRPVLADLLQDAEAHSAERVANRPPLPTAAAG